MKRYLLIAILALQVVLLSSCNTKKDSALLLPNRTGVISVSISCDDERETITDKREIDSLFANLSTVRIKSGESYNDSPMTDKFIKIFFEVSDGLSGAAGMRPFLRMSTMTAIATARRMEAKIIQMPHASQKPAWK